MSESFAKRLRTLERARSSLYKQERFGEVMQALLSLLADARGVDQRISVRASMLTHFCFIGDNAAALRTIDEQIREKPDDVVSFIDLTEHFHYYQVDLLKAAETVEHALAMATEQSLLVRQVLGVRMRIALETRNFDVARDSLVRLVEYKPQAHLLDVAYEHDFIEKIPPGAIDAALIERYRELLRAN